MDDIYDFFDDIVCINLTISRDRRMHVENIFQKYNIPGRFFITDKHPYGGLYGCFDSHIKVVKSAYERGLNNILVFEDDFTPSPSYSEEKIAKAIEFMRSSDDWDIFYFGYSFMMETYEHGVTFFPTHGVRVSKDIIQYNAGMAHALCYSRNAMKKIIDTYQDYIGILHYDKYITGSIELKNYCILPIIFQQVFDTKYNIEPQNAMEIIIRKILYPIDTSINFTYNISKFHYDLTTNAYRRYYKYMFLITTSIILHIIKRYLLRIKYNIII